MDTTQLYYYFFHKTPNMILKSKYSTCLCQRMVELEVKNGLPSVKALYWLKWFVNCYLEHKEYFGFLQLSGVVMILAASLEFEKNHNSEVIERPSDNEEIPMVSIYCYIVRRQ